MVALWAGDVPRNSHCHVSWEPSYSVEPGLEDAVGAGGDRGLAPLRA